MYKIMVFLVAIALSSQIVMAKTPKTDDGQDRAKSDIMELDEAAGKLKAQAAGDIKGFLGAVSEAHKIPLAVLEKMVDKDKIPAADVAIIGQLKSLSGKSIEEVTDQYKKSKGKGWGVTAQGLGIKPGSPEFKAFKDGLNKSVEKNERAKGKDKEGLEDKAKDKIKESIGGKGKGKSKGK